MKNINRNAFKWKNIYIKIIRKALAMQNEYKNERAKTYLYYGDYPGGRSEYEHDNVLVENSR
ncbi:MAG: hypothetical protein QW379_08840 [Thermoplasmata archaeon]